jgi:hypothetical protein
MYLLGMFLQASNWLSSQVHEEVIGIRQAISSRSVGTIISKGKLSGPNMITYLIWTHVLECCVVRCGYNIIHYKHVCFKKIGARAQNLATNLRLIVNLIGRIYMIN